MYEYEIKGNLDRVLEKIAKKDKGTYIAVMKKILQLAENPHLGKPLRKVLKGRRRVQVGHLVLTYRIDEGAHRVVFLKLDPHDNAYKRA